MERISIAQAKDNLDELVHRAAAGEEIVISDPSGRAVRLQPVEASAPTRPKRTPGRWKGRVSIPGEALLAPLNDEELAWLSGETSP